MSILSNCLIEHLKRLKESSKEAVENTDYFNGINEYMHVKRPVEDELLELIQRASQSEKPQLILVCGGVGDGKSHLIAYLKNTHPDLLGKFSIHNDATESFEPSKTSLDTLNDFLDDFSDEKIIQEVNSSKLIVAINLGSLNNFIDSGYQDHFTKLREYVLQKNILESKIINNEFTEYSNFHSINFSDYNIFSLTETGVRSEYLKGLFEKIANKGEWNNFYTIYKHSCIGCPCENRCPVKVNYELLTQDSIQIQLIEIIVEAILKHKLIVSTRSILNFIYEILVPNDLDVLAKSMIEASLDQIKFIEYINSLMPNLIYDHKDRSSLSRVLATLDPLGVRTSDLDDLLITLNTTRGFVKLFAEHVDITGLTWLEDEFQKENFLDETTISELKNALIKTLVRLYKFRPKSDVLCLEDIVYRQFLKDLYSWNAGDLQGIKTVFTAVIESLFKWNGEGQNHRINLLIGKNQIKYRISQLLELSPHLGSLPNMSSGKLDKFLPYIILFFKNKKKETLPPLEISIDYSLYLLLEQVRNGYRPNKKDKQNFINYMEFMNKVLLLGEQDKELKFEQKFSGNILRFKLSYNEDFEEYKFVRA